VHDELTELLVRLVEIDSVNPSLVAGAAGEAGIAAFVAAWAEANGLEAHISEAAPGRPSVLVRAQGRGGGKTLLLCGHLDTVGVDRMAEPFTPRIDGERLFGRGAYDMKAGVAAALVACRDAARLGLAGDVIVAAVADEEYASIGIQQVLGSLRADAAIVTEPTELEIAIAHKGFAWIELVVTGRAAHGSRPHLGIDAIVKTGPLLVALAELDAALAGRVHPLLGRPSIHASLIDGGVELSSYPASCTLKLERRTLPGETLAGVEAEIERLLERCRAADPELNVERRTLLARDPFEIDGGAEIVEVVRRASGEATIGGASYWADSGFIAAAGIPTVLFGPGGEGAHAVEEWVSLADTAAVARALVATAVEFCA
jgi:acetylornithine deacetylase